jgi:hypothetical protein
MLLWLLACSGSDESKQEVQANENLTSVEEHNDDLGKTDAEGGLVMVTDSGLVLSLPRIDKATSTKLCFLQEMPEQEVGITGVTYKTKGDGLQLIRLRMIENASRKNIGKWLDCETLGDGYFTKPVIEITGVDLENTKEPPFNGLNWVNLPEGIAFPYPSEVWLFEAWISEGTSDIDISVAIDTTPIADVKHFAGVVEMDLGTPSSDAKQSFTCPWAEEVNVVSVMGYAAPGQGTFTVSCDGKEIYSVDSAKFSSDPPPVGNFPAPVKISESCTVTCDWEEEAGTICTASIVAYPLPTSQICIDGSFQ